MGKLKRLIITSALLLFVILSFNLAGYFYRLGKTTQKDNAKEGAYVSASQQVLTQQLSRKVSVLTIHHYFSEDQYLRQVQETRQLIAQLNARQDLLHRLVETAAVSDPERARIRSLYDRTTIAYQGLLALVREEIGKAPNKEEDYEAQLHLRSAEGDYLAAMQNLNSDLRMLEKQLDHSLVMANDIMIILLISGMVFLTFILIVPVVRLNTRTYHELQATLEQVKAAKEAIIQSEFKYRQLFQSNPMPMWIFDVDTLEFLEVNDRMVEHYGYTRQELAQMKALDIRPERERNRLHAILPTLNDENQIYTLGKWVHCTRSGEEIIVEIITHKLNYNGRDALLVLANDVTRNVRLQEELLVSRVDRQRELTKAALSIQEKERNEIGKELHDNVNQILTSAKLHLELVNSHPEDKHLLKTTELVNAAIQEIRRLSSTLVPSTFNDMGLLMAIDDLVENLNHHPLDSIQFTPVDFDETGLDNDFKLTLFRIVQEQLTNVVKHAEATRAEIRLEQSPREIRLVISDNGKGFDKFQKKKGIGISNIVNRADSFGGTVSITTGPGEGCRLEVFFPAMERLLTVA